MNAWTIRRRRSCRPVALAGLLIAIITSGCRQTEKSLEWDSIHWGPPASGLQVGFAVQKQGAGEPQVEGGGVYVQIILRNSGDQPLRIVKPGVVLQCAGSDPSLMDAVAMRDDGRITRVGLVSRGDGGRISVWELKPGEIRQVKGPFGEELWFAPFMWGLTKLDGRCAVTYHNAIDHSRTFTMDPFGKEEEVSGLWTGDIVSGLVPVHIEPQPPKYPELGDAGSG